MQYVEEYIQINGLAHYFVNYEHEEKDFCLFIHGGPGQSYSNFAYYLDVPYLNMAFYDQRGAGKTLLYTKDQGTLSLEQLLMDLDEIVNYICQKYHKDKIYLMGHSWGSILGSLYALRHPEKLKGYFGSGQVVNFIECEKVSINRLKEKMNNDKKMACLKEYPEVPKELFIKLLGKARKLENKYGVFYMNKDLNMMKVYRESPSFKLSDIMAMLKGFKVNNEMIIEELIPFNLHETKYECPIYYLIGEYDIQTSIELSKDYFSKIEAPIKEFFAISNSGHSPMLENKEEFFEAIKKILDKCH